MNTYRSIYRLKVVHNYFTQDICRAIQISVTTSGLDIMKRRGMTFKQTGINEWCVICNQVNIGTNNLSDVIMLGMSISDAAFMYYTDWKDFYPSSVYRLALPAPAIDASVAIKRTDEKRKINSSFCSIELQLTEDMFHVMQEGNCLTDVLTFHSKELRWEYLFIPRSEDAWSEKEYILKEADDKIHFSPLGMTEIYGKKAWHFLSKEKIKLREQYYFRISLQEIVSNRPQAQRLLIKDVPHPVPGKFINEQTAVLRHICYF